MALFCRANSFVACRLSGDQRTHRGHQDSVEIDPERHFATANCGIAKGLFDHIVGAELKRRRHVDADCLGGFEIDDQLEFCGLLNWEIGGFRPV
jgi:hypothetical protein